MRRLRTVWGLTLALLLTIATSVVAPDSASALAAGGVRTTLTIVAHPDDDLLFMNPDILDEIQSGASVWTVYLSDGRRNGDPGQNDTRYVDERLAGVRAAYATMSGVPDDWSYEPLTINGRQIATMRLKGTNVHLASLFIKGAANCCTVGDPFGDLYRMVRRPSYVAFPTDGRDPYTRASFVATLRALISVVNPEFIRSQYSLGHRGEGLQLDHCDHVSAALLTAAANVDAQSRTIRPRQEYWQYGVRARPDNTPAALQKRKFDAWKAYVKHDTESRSPDAWDHGLRTRQYRAMERTFVRGGVWEPPADFTSCPDRSGRLVTWS